MGVFSLWENDSGGRWIISTKFDPINLTTIMTKMKKKKQYTHKQTETHYANTPMKFAAIFKGCKHDNFQIKIMFQISQNNNCGYT